MRMPEISFLRWGDIHIRAYVCLDRNSVKVRVPGFFGNHPDGLVMTIPEGADKIRNLRKTPRYKIATKDEYGCWREVGLGVSSSSDSYDVLVHSSQSRSMSGVYSRDYQWLFGFTYGKEFYRYVLAMKRFLMSYDHYIHNDIVMKASTLTTFPEQAVSSPIEATNYVYDLTRYLNPIAVLMQRNYKELAEQFPKLWNCPRQDTIERIP